MKRRTFLKLGLLVPTAVSGFTPTGQADFTRFCDPCLTGGKVRFDLSTPVVQDVGCVPTEFSTDARCLVRRPAPWFNQDLSGLTFPDMSKMQLGKAGKWRPWGIDDLVDRQLTCLKCRCTGWMDAHECGRCHGAGEIYDADGVEERCPACEGTGYEGTVKCDRCRRGWVTRESTAIIGGSQFDRGYIDLITDEMQPDECQIRMFQYNHGDIVTGVMMFRGRRGSGLLSPLRD